MGNETKPVAESRFDLQQMLGEIESEDRQHTNRKVEQSEIQELFNERKKRGDNE